jgi:hypothetical protein
MLSFIHQHMQQNVHFIETGAFPDIFHYDLSDYFMPDIGCVG